MCNTNKYTKKPKFLILLYFWSCFNSRQKFYLNYMIVVLQLNFLIFLTNLDFQFYPSFDFLS